MPAKKDKKPKTDGDESVMTKKSLTPVKKSPSPKPAKVAKASKKEEEKKIAPADEIKPKRATSAYLYYNTEMTKKLREKDKDLAQKDAMKQAGEIW